MYLHSFLRGAANAREGLLGVMPSYAPEGDANITLDGLGFLEPCFEIANARLGEVNASPL